MIESMFFVAATVHASHSYGAPFDYDFLTIEQADTMLPRVGNIATRCTAPRTLPASLLLADDAAVMYGFAST